MSNVQFSHNIQADGVILTAERETPKTLFRKAKAEPVDSQQWLPLAGGAVLPAIARLEAAIEDGEDGVLALEDSKGFFLNHSFVSSLTDAQAAALQLPPPLPFVIRLDATGALIADDATVALKYLGSGGRQVFPRRVGCFLLESTAYYRLPEHMYDLILAAERVSEKNSLDERLDGLAELRSHLSVLGSGAISADQQIEGLKIAHASALSVKVTENLEFDPILYSREQLSEDDDALLSEREQLLTPRQQAAFADAFRRRDGAKRTYLADDVFVYVDPSLRVATSVVREMQDAPAEERKRFLKSPHSFIRMALVEKGADEEFVDELVASSFVITEELSARVKDLGIWKPPVLPFREGGSNDWKTIEFGIRIGDRKVVITPDELNAIGQQIAEAIQGSVPVVALDDTRELPADQQTLDAINALRKELAGLPPVHIPEEDDVSPVDDDSQVQGESDSEDDGQDDSGPSVLLVQTNHDNETFSIETQPRRHFSGYVRPAGLLNEPKQHQVEGITWLEECWSLGFGGALLADDMGLGKTFQTLAFLSWLKEARKDRRLPKRPTLIVAPTSLLGTWQAEAKLHLEEESLGTFSLLYGSHLKSMKTSRENDVTAGRATLRLESLSSSEWILTTYETMRDYHISLAQLPFSCGVFDEMQKLKNETSLMTNASRSLNIDFKLGLTGTPVENSLQDLWSILDTLMPGALGLGSMKEFTRYYIDADDDSNVRQERMAELNERITQRLDDKPPPMLRRMKVDVAKDLPLKREHTIDRDMPQHQADCYHQALTTLREGNTRKQKIEAFHRMRAVSLHPEAYDGSTSESPEAFVGESARLSQALELLDQIHGRGEKALVFVESIEMHRWLSAYLPQRYGMAHRPERIYGQVSSAARQKIVERFQSPDNKGFDVLLLSPKAAGVGLTLTAASNVIHLTRWWNPAVEDQCTDRAYRIGQTQDVNVYYPRAIHPVYQDRSFDAILHNLLERKRELSRHVLAPARADEALSELVADLEH